MIPFITKQTTILMINVNRLDKMLKNITKAKVKSPIKMYVNNVFVLKTAPAAAYVVYEFTVYNYHCNEHPR